MIDKTRAKRLKTIRKVVQFQKLPEVAKLYNCIEYEEH